MSGWAEQRRAKRILARDQTICHMCGRPCADEVDHVIPLEQGGADHPSNLAAIHRRCHVDKTQAEARAGRTTPTT